MRRLKTCSVVQGPRLPPYTRTEVLSMLLVHHRRFVEEAISHIGTWNTRTLRAAGKLQELTHEMDRYRWNILGLCEMRWKSFGETTIEEGHKVSFSGKDDKHEQGVGFRVHKDIVNTVMGCRPVSSRLITIRLRAVPFSITIVQAYAQTSDYGDNEIEEFYDQLQNVIDQTPEKDILVVQGDECKSGQGCLWKLARHLWTLLQ